MERLEHIDLYDLDIPLDTIDFFDYYNSERNIINPALTKAGYKLLSAWYSADYDSFGPLSRAVVATTPQGKRVIIWYG